MGLTVLLAGCAAEEPTQTEPIWSLSGQTMGTRYSVSVVGGDEAEAETLRGRIDARLAELNRRLSTYDPKSELSRFNALRDADAWFAVDAETATVVAYALSVAQQSDGAFDPTVGPLVNLWGFGPGKSLEEPPTDEAVASTLNSAGYEGVATQVSPPALRKSIAEACVDLSAVAKGYGVDAVCEVVATAGYDAFMVEIGGEVRAAGRKPDGSPWRIGVERADEPLRFEGGRRLQEVVPLADRALATSGDYRNYFEHEGVRYSHTIDPRTGRPVTHTLATVSVAAETCMEADAMATALLVLGPRKGYDWAVERGMAALFVERAKDDRLVERATPPWAELVANASEGDAAP